MQWYEQKASEGTAGNILMVDNEAPRASTGKAFKFHEMHNDRIYSQLTRLIPMTGLCVSIFVHCVVHYPCPSCLGACALVDTLTGKELSLPAELNAVTAYI